MRVLMLADNLSAGGTQRRLIELIKGFQEYDDIQIRLIVFSDAIAYPEISELDVQVDILRRKPKKNPLIFHRVYKICKKWKPDIIHSWGTMSTIWIIPSSLLLKIKVINGNIVNATPNMGFFDLHFIRARLTYPFSSVIVANSIAGLKAYDVPKQKGRYIYNGFDRKRFSNLRDPEEVRNELNIQTEYIVGMVSRFEIEKDYVTFINAGIKLLEDRNDVTFVAVGGGTNLESSKALIPAKYQDQFVFTGNRSDVESIVNIFSIGVLATNTRIHLEGISNAILEYMALEKPVVATLGGGTNEIVDHAQTGFLIAPYSPDDMAIQVGKLLDNPEMIRDLGLKGRRRADTLFDLGKMSAQYYELYQNLTKEE